MLAALRAIPSLARVDAGERVAERVSRLAEFTRAQRVIAYAALASELPTVPLVAVALAAGKELLWPRLALDGSLELAAARPDELALGERGFATPPRDRAASALRAGDLVLAPGLAFTRAGARLGRGGGHYDRLLAKERGALTVGIAFDIQLLRELPMEPHDRRMEIVITPSGAWRKT